MIMKIPAWILACGLTLLPLAGSARAGAPASSPTCCAKVEDAGKSQPVMCGCCRCNPCACQKCECCGCRPCACK